MICAGSILYHGHHVRIRVTRAKTRQVSCSQFSPVVCPRLKGNLVKTSWWSSVVVSTLALINEVNLRWTRLVLRWVTVSGSIPGAGHLFHYVTNQPPKANSAFHPSGVGKWVPASAGKEKAGMVHSVSGWTRGVQVKLWDDLRTRAIPERLRDVFTTGRYTNPHLPLPYLYLVAPAAEDLWYDDDNDEWWRWWMMIVVTMMNDDHDDDEWWWWRW